MLRLFSSFARGWPGFGLLLMRLVAAIALIDQVALTLQGGTHTKPILLAILSLGLALLLLAGLWTPIAGVIATVVELETHRPSGSKELTIYAQRGAIPYPLELRNATRYSRHMALSGVVLKTESIRQSRCQVGKIWV